MRIKNWSNYQHYSNRNPPWIRLHKSIIDDPDWHELDGQTAKVLVMLWLLASEDEEMMGSLPCVRKICFRLRMTENQINQAISKLSHWLEHDASTMLAGGLHDAPKNAPDKRQRRDRGETDIMSGSKPDHIPYASIVSYLNEKAGSDFKPSSKVTKDHIKARWSEGFTLDDFKAVIDFKTEEWLADEKMQQYLRPQTLFATKFESYLQAYKASGSRPVSVNRCNRCQYNQREPCRNLSKEGFDPTQCKSFIDAKA